MADQTLIRRINRARVLDAIRRRGRLSRSDVAGITDLDKKSITNVMGELLEEEYVVEAGKRRTRKGRPFVLLELKKDRHLGIGLSLSEQGVTAALLNLGGEIVALHEIDYLPSPKLADILRAARRAYEQVRSVARGHLDGVGLTVPGLVDLPSGKVVRSVNIPAINGVDIRGAVAGFARGPVLFEEATRAKALAEKWFGLGRDLPSFVCVELGIGIGMGIVHAGRLFASGKEYVGELGHIRVEEGGRPCPCGNRGCLEAYLSETVLLREINRAQKTDLPGLAHLEKPGPAASKVLREAGRRLGLGLSYVINLICPPAIVLNGPLTKFADLVLPEVNRAAREATLPGLVERTSIRVSALDHASALGAAALTLSRTFEVEGHYYV
jgi:predicted NBD/HSP70 family sugar kinase